MADFIYHINPQHHGMYSGFFEYKMKNWDYPAIDTINRTLETAEVNFLLYILAILLAHDG